MSNNIKRIIVACLLLQCTSSFSQELDPRSYIDLPIGQNFFGALYIYTEGDVYTSPDVPVEDLTLEIDGPAIAYARTFELFGNASKFDINVGQACSHGEAIYLGEDATRDYCGITDTRVRLNYNFYGAKAKTMKEFVKQPKGIVIGGSLQVSAPTGQYDDKYILNIGANRWFFKPEIGTSIPFGSWELDLSVSAKISTDNNDLQGSKKFEQDPIYNVQSHLIYDIGPGQWISLNGNYFWGGDTFVDGRQTANKAENYRAGITYSKALNSQHSIKFLANKGVTTNRGNDSVVYAVAWAYRWD
ncbi:transporter [Thalassotalea psychrophila]|uniref:Transporter n=1 Tax=Thalassotalea psychrophila TaxID=3065647 RepID=A0ABY9TSI9_9GAMM|nr:transporter [Colwelliaceae bacterium SQ149]